MGLLLVSVATIHALSVDEIIRIKKAGVNDSTIELLIMGSGDAPSAGGWRQDGWIVYLAQSRFPETAIKETIITTSPVDVSPLYYRGHRLAPRWR